jgi:hypothetical protein
MAAARVSCITAGGAKEQTVKADGKAPATPMPVTKQAARSADKGAPNAPLKFQLDKLERSSPYLAKNGDSPRKPSWISALNSAPKT